MSGIWFLTGHSDLSLVVTFCVQKGEAHRGRRTARGGLSWAFRCQTVATIDHDHFPLGLILYYALPTAMVITRNMLRTSNAWQ
jgi:hypothetical protein